MGKNRKFDERFRRQAVQLAIDLDNTSKAARQLGITPSAIAAWRNLYGEKDQCRSPKKESAEMQRLRKENEELKSANYILKRAAAFFSQDHLK